ncbi:NTP transferase domain-containing protein [Isoptericola sp. NPDC057653]|uniref:nucleotidyltransferase family protein n=1 Tax=Isoptericola sp. NPDC057653 TaxID=3346195 RepID=UPI0036CCC03B
MTGPATGPAPAAGRSVAVLLAAGAGTRLGRGPKALLPHRGRPLVEHVARVLADGGCDDVVVVLGADAARVATAADRLTGTAGVRVVVNERWATGMGSSLQAGVAAALQPDDGSPVARVVVAHVDQPGVTPGDVARLLAAHRPGRVTASLWADAPASDQAGPEQGRPRWSHPLVLDAALAGPAAASAEGDAGARAFLRAHAALIDVVTHPGDGRDLDTEADLDLLA